MASDQGLHSLHMHHKKDARHTWIKKNKVISVPVYSISIVNRQRGDTYQAEFFTNMLLTIHNLMKWVVQNKKKIK